MVVECVAQVAAGASNGRLEAAQALQAPHRLIVVKVTLEAATLEFCLNLMCFIKHIEDD